MIPTGWWGVGVSGAVRKPLSTRGTIGLLLAGATSSSTTNTYVTHSDSFQHFGQRQRVVSKSTVGKFSGWEFAT
jgi:hypothetical protein